MKRPLSPEEFKTIYSKVPRLCIDLIIKTEGGIVLSLRNIAPYRGNWHLPGGTVLYKEKITYAIRRVALEELGILITPQKLLGYIEYPNEKENGGFAYTVSMAFLCFSNDTDFKSNDEATKIKIFRNLPASLINEQRVFLESLGDKFDI